MSTPPEAVQPLVAHSVQHVRVEAAHAAAIRAHAPPHALIGRACAQFLDDSRALLMAALESQNSGRLEFAVAYVRP